MAREPAYKEEFHTDVRFWWSSMKEACSAPIRQSHHLFQTWCTVWEGQSSFHTCKNIWKSKDFQTHIFSPKHSCFYYVLFTPFKWSFQVFSQKKKSLEQVNLQFDIFSFHLATNTDASIMCCRIILLHLNGLFFSEKKLYNKLTCILTSFHLLPTFHSNNQSTCYGFHFYKPYSTMSKNMTGHHFSV